MVVDLGFWSQSVAGSCPDWVGFLKEIYFYKYFFIFVVFFACLNGLPCSLSSLVLVLRVTFWPGLVDLAPGQDLDPGQGSGQGAGTHILAYCKHVIANTLAYLEDK